MKRRLVEAIIILIIATIISIVGVSYSGIKEVNNIIERIK